MRTIGAFCVVGVIAALVVVPVGPASDQARCTPTPNGGGGPDRGTAPLRAKIGTGHVLTGVVLSPSCAPIAGARVSFWQSNRKGVYTAAGRGAVRTNRLGRFRFEGPMPTSYAGQPAHIHIKVEAPGFEPLYTRYEPRGTRRGTVRLVLLPSGV
jgi:protocatechuate 3,4-dioxygenase beta subunit